MATLAQGSSVTLTLTASDSILIDSAATGRARIEAVSGITGSANQSVLATHSGGQATYGPFGAGDVKINAVGGALTYIQGTAPLFNEGGFAKFAVDDRNDITGLVDQDGNEIGIVASRYCYFHGFAGQQIVGDPKFYDLAGSNHGVFGANLSNANAWATAGYVSTIDPTGGSTDSVIRIPSLNFDYAGGEKLIVWWLGYATPEGSDVAMLGDGSATTTAKGVRLRMKTTGKYDLSLFGTTQGFSGDSDGAVFDGTLHSLGFVFDGAAKTHGLWSDDVYHPSMGSVLQTFSSSTAFDTTNSNTFNIGSPFPASASSTTGAATKTRAMCIYRLPANQTMLTVAEITALFQQLRANPSKLALATAV